MKEAHMEVQPTVAAPEFTPVRSEIVEGFGSFSEVKLGATSLSAAELLPRLEIGTGLKASDGATADTARSTRPVHSSSGASGSDRIAAGQRERRAGTETVGGSFDKQDNLPELAERRIENPEERKKFLEDMNSFEQRAKARGLPEAEIKATFDNVGRLLEGTTDAKVSPELRALAARGLAHHLADPTTMDQGNGNLTCGATTIGERLITRHPAMASDMVASAALTGNWMSPNGDGTFKSIAVDKSAFEPNHASGERRVPPNDRDRTFATRIMNHVVINDIYQRDDVKPMMNGQESSANPIDQKWRGERTGSNITGPSGEFLMWRSETYDRQMSIKFPGIGKPPMREQLERLTGATGVVVGREPAPEAAVSALEHARATSNFPLIFEVDQGHPKFGGEDAPGFSHYVSITGYNAETGKYSVSNQYGRKYDLDVTKEELLAARPLKRGRN